MGWWALSCIVVFLSQVANALKGGTLMFHQPQTHHEFGLSVLHKKKEDRPKRTFTKMYLPILETLRLHGGQAAQDQSLVDVMAIRRRGTRSRFTRRFALLPSDSERHSVSHTIHPAAKKKLQATINLPKTAFDVHLNGALRDQSVQSYWESKHDAGILAFVNEQRIGVATPAYVIGDGPPYANGKLHLGHAMNKIIKDIVLKYKLLCGMKVIYRPGWDCHGLPIEKQVLSMTAHTDKKANRNESKEIQPSSLGISGIKRARDYAMRQVNEQRQEFKRFGVWAEWASPYLTMDKAYEAAELEVLRAIYNKGLVKRSLHPVNWSVSSRTPLADAELVYNDTHVSTAAFIKFKVSVPSVSLASALKTIINERFSEVSAVGVGEHLPISLVAWTTAPWTLVGNVALAVNPLTDYSILSMKRRDENPLKSVSDGSRIEKEERGIDGTVEGRELFVVARGQVEYLTHMMTEWVSHYDPYSCILLGSVPGYLIVNTTYDHPLLHTTRSASSHQPSDIDSKNETPSVRRVVPQSGSLEVVESQGTGIVHIAPGHGPQDYEIAMAEGLAVPVVCDENGRLSTNHSELKYMEGVPVLSEGTDEVLKMASRLGNNVCSGAHQHRYPYDSRSGTPVVLRAIKHWMIAIDKVKEKAKEFVSTIQWIPECFMNRIGSMINDRREWCISRHRIWGLPLPVFYEVDTDMPLMNNETLTHAIELFRNYGSAVWWEFPVADLLPPTYRDVARKYRRGNETLDVWFDSGASWWASTSDHNVLGPSGHIENPTTVADLYVEGADQHRGWFQSVVLTSAALRHAVAPVKSILTHGFVLDPQARKMSKSLGNIVRPSDIVNPLMGPNTGTLAHNCKGSKKSKSSRSSSPRSPSSHMGLGADVLRLWVASIDYSRDVDFSFEALSKVNGMMKNIRNRFRYLFGNLNDFDAKVHKIETHHLSSLDRYMISRLSRIIQTVDQAYQDFHFTQVVTTIMGFMDDVLSHWYLDICRDRLYCGSKDSLSRRSCQTVLWVVTTVLCRWLAPIAPHLAEEIYQHQFPLPNVELWDSRHNTIFQTRFDFAKALMDVEAQDERWDFISQLGKDVNKALQMAREKKGISTWLEAHVVLHTGSSRMAALVESLNHPLDALSNPKVRHLSTHPHTRSVAQSCTVHSTNMTPLHSIELNSLRLVSWCSDGVVIKLH
eukprot:GHVN01067001.1.p1 GENE.GHVN01067001.1~~GHVN01067001.1.p1  ORF type:complete len:1179 (-),score=169.45 GHVN01067001.1:1040-4576(-)